MTRSGHSRGNRSTLLYAALGLVFVVSMLIQLRIASNTVVNDHVSLPFFTLATASPDLEVVSPEAQKAGLGHGDALLAIDGKPYTGTAMRAEAFEKSKLGQEIRFTVDTRSGIQDIEVRAVRVWKSTFRISVGLVLNLIMPIGCILLGCWVVWVCPHNKLAWLLLGLLLSISQVATLPYQIEGWGSGVRELAMGYHLVFLETLPIFMFLFGFFFPEPLHFWTQPGTWLKSVPWVVITPLIAKGIIEIFIGIREISSYAAVRPLQEAIGHVEPILAFYAYCVAGLGFFGATFVKAATASSPDAQRRLRLLSWGASIALAPLFILILATWIRRQSIYDLTPRWLLALVLVALILFPLTLAYVIVVQRAMDVGVVVRQGLQYGFAAGGIKVVQGMITVIVIVAAISLVKAQDHGLATDAAIVAVSIALYATIRHGTERLQAWIDRQFFREAYDTEQVLGELSDQVRSIIDSRRLVETVAIRIAEVLHVRQLAVVLGSSESSFQPIFSLGYNTTPDVRFSSATGAVRVLEQHKEPIHVYFEDRKSWLYRTPEVTDEDRSQLLELETELLLPLETHNRLLGFISLGPKRSEAPYSRMDLRLLKSVATQTGLALENVHLMATITEELTHRERLKRELEIAREVQERLFPQTLPLVSGIDYAGNCRPALGVGGDYYDFIGLPDGQLGVAIGDVSGKGIAAALMMATVQASLRGEVTRSPQNLSSLFSGLNRRVYESSSADRYITLFYAQYNPTSRELTYVNAGHNPPMIFRCVEGNWLISRLSTGGTVVGLFEECSYQQGTFTLTPDDLLVAFTDGISEAMNNADEEWGEQDLIENVKNCSSFTASEMIASILRAAEKFADGAKQNDDMTLLVLRVDSPDETLL